MTDKQKQLKAKGIDMTANLEQLELIRTEAIRYLIKEKPTNWDIHVNELTRGSAIFIEGTYRIGRWIFDFRSMTLLREADIAPEVRRYGLLFRKESDSVFRVTQDFWESESYDFSE